MIIHTNNKIVFNEPLQEALILRRTNRFLMEVLYKNEKYICHCPCTGSINNIIFKNVPCLLSTNDNQKRKTKYTVEAISLNNIDEKNKYWVGINQNKANRYVEFFLKNNMLKDMVDCRSIAREQTINKSRIDFKVNDCYLEVKTPLHHLNLKPYYFTNENIKQKNTSTYESVDRFFKHLEDLSKTLKNNSRAILIAFFMFEVDNFVPPAIDKNSDVIASEISKIKNLGVEMWQVSTIINKNGLSLYNYKIMDF